MIVTAHIQSIDLGGKARFEKQQYDLWVTTTPTITTNPITADAATLLSLNRDFRFNVEAKSLKISVIHAKLFGNETICELELDLTQIPLNTIFRSIVRMKALRQADQPTCDLTLALHTGFENPPSIGNVSLQNFEKAPEGLDQYKAQRRIKHISSMSLLQDEDKKHRTNSLRATSARVSSPNDT
ncbi:hypothetical protein TRFO_32416 [Tritrichomonas foetus]|uniref:Uncharacterized protein n=1 Tax=Tritrichomonas foetus TaxID=1144522 RepID=A0A1J4JR11_9EUKA|nr:hypothetical protein TRFO_32416 [Tritrichomonas foetus]|eukprot:OHT00848.1 hypothetical protein TRFO_32416 [Tritrichomonas foetus]